MSVATRINKPSSVPVQDFSKALVVSLPLDQIDFTEDVSTLFEYVMPTNDMAPSIPRGSLVTLGMVELKDVSVGDVLLRVYCGPNNRKALEHGRLKMPSSQDLYRTGCITLTRDVDGLILFDNLPWVMRNIYWFRVEQVLRIARPARYWPPAPAKVTT